MLIIRNEGGAHNSYNAANCCECTLQPIGKVIDMVQLVIHLNAFTQICLRQNIWQLASGNSRRNDTIL